MKSKVCNDIKKVMTCKKVRHNIKVRHDVKKVWKVDPCYDIKKYVMPGT